MELLPVVQMSQYNASKWNVYYSFIQSIQGGGICSRSLAQEVICQNSPHFADLCNQTVL